MMWQEPFAYGIGRRKTVLKNNLKKTVTIIHLLCISKYKQTVVNIKTSHIKDSRRIKL